MDLTLAFHLFSLVAFLVLLAAVHKLWAQRELARELWQQFGQTPRAKVIVNWPATFLDGFCASLDISYESVGKSKDTAPVRIRPRALLELFYETPFKLIRYEDRSGSRPEVTISVLKPLQNVEEWQAKLTSAFNGQCVITIKYEPSTKDVR